MFMLASIISGSLTVKGQESMVPGISYNYLEKLITIAKKNYPEVRIKNYQSAIAKNNITKNAVSWLDAFSVSYYYRPTRAIDIANPNFFNGYQFGINVNLGTLLLKPFAIKEAQQQYKVAQLQEQEYGLTIESEVKQRYFAYVEQLSQLKLRSKSFGDAEALVRELRTKFEKGEAAFDDLQRALLLSTEQNQYMITAESGVFTKKAALEEIVGEKLENVK